MKISLLVRIVSVGISCVQYCCRYWCSFVLVLIPFVEEWNTCFILRLYEVFFLLNFLEFGPVIFLRCHWYKSFNISFTERMWFETKYKSQIVWVDCYSQNIMFFGLIVISFLNKSLWNGINRKTAEPLFSYHFIWNYFNALLCLLKYFKLLTERLTFFSKKCYNKCHTPIQFDSIHVDRYEFLFLQLWNIYTIS